MRFDPVILHNNPAARQPIVAVMEAALTAVDPAAAVSRALSVNSGRFEVDGRVYDLGHYERILVLGAGKAGAPMVQAVEAALSSHAIDGLVVVKTGHGGPTQQVEIVEAAHPRPDEAGVAAGERILDLASNAGPKDLVITLLSGGGSALLVAPAAGITLTDLQVMTDTLLASGATINEINCLRKHCSAIKGGQLARAVAPATLVTLALSDVVGSPLDVIASGPTVPDSSTWQDAWAIVERYGLEASLPPSIYHRLQEALAGTIADTPKAGDRAFAEAHSVIIADNRAAALAAVAEARRQGFNAELLTTYLEGDATQAAHLAVALAREIRVSGHPLQPPACLAMGGETTVQLGTNPGKGGRNQTLALTAALNLSELPANEAIGITIAALATDGTDGPTDSAGGLVDAKTIARGDAQGLDAEHHLEADDAYPYLNASGDLLITGPTRTNVNDLVLVFVDG